MEKVVKVGPQWIALSLFGLLVKYEHTIGKGKKCNQLSGHFMHRVHQQTDKLQACYT